MTATQHALLDIPGATEGTTQWKVEKLHLLAWGGFHSYTAVELAPTVTLLSGASGTGKSTLLDAYIALLMDSGTPFNGASNDVTIGRARGSEQRSLVSYLRGKMDTNRSSAGELEDQVLRGRDSATWGALAVTFIDDLGRQYTVARLYYVPRSAIKDGDLVRKMCTIEGTVYLPDLEPFAAGRFDKRAVEGRFANLKMHESYTAFAQAFCTRLGIGPHGDGAKALRLLARIQAGHQIPTVDDLYKKLVLEQPGTYAAADAAVEHFKDLEDAYEAMESEAKKAEVLAPIPALWGEREAAREQVRLIDTFGLGYSQRDTPFGLWKLTTEDRLLEAVEDNLRAERETLEKAKRTAQEREADLNISKANVEADLGENESHTTVARLDADLDRLRLAREAARERRDTFDRLTARLGLTIEVEDDFDAARATSKAFLDQFQATLDDLDRQRALLNRQIAAPLTEKDDLTVERESLKDRKGRMDHRLHVARLAMAQAAGVRPEDLPFVGELVDVRDGEQRWRKAIETTLFGIARVMLVDANHLEQFSRAIDEADIPARVNFQGIDLSAFQPENLDPRYISGKLDYKDTPFTNWVLDRLTDDNTDALCVNTPDELSGGGQRVTINGQTRRGRSGAHGSNKAPYVIGFSSADRLREIDGRISELNTLIGEFGKQERGLNARSAALVNDKSAHDHIVGTAWAAIDEDGITDDINELSGQRDRIIDADDDLRALKEEHVRILSELKKANGDLWAANHGLARVETSQNDVIARKDHVVREIERIERDQQVVLTDTQTDYLDSEYSQVANEADLDEFRHGGWARLKTRLGEQLKGANEKVSDKTRALESTFRRYLDRWEDPNLSESVENYDTFRRIYEDIIARGLADRRAEWSKRLTDWSGQDLVPLAGAFSMAIEEIRQRLDPVNTILERLPFGAHRDRLRIDLRELHRDDIVRFKKELRILSRVNADDFTEEQIQNWFKRLRKFMLAIRKDTTGRSTRDRDYFLDVNRHIEITAVAYDPVTKVDRSTYAALGGKSGGETQELVAFIVGAALRFQLGDDTNTRPRFAPVFLDEGFVKADSEFAGRAVDAWKGLGFQLIIGAPYGQFTALEPHAEQILYMSKSDKGISYVKPVQPISKPAVTEAAASEATG
jgi:uncharacterized protein YPO0396